jgi:hypothetical protein
MTILFVQYIKLRLFFPPYRTELVCQLLSVVVVDFLHYNLTMNPIQNINSSLRRCIHQLHRTGLRNVTVTPTTCMHVTSRLRYQDGYFGMHASLVNHEARNFYKFVFTPLNYGVCSLTSEAMHQDTTMRPCF